MSKEKYIKATTARAVATELEIDGFFSFVSSTIEAELRAVANKLGKGKRLTIKDIETLFRADNWLKIERKLLQKKNIIIKNLITSLNLDLQELQTLYGVILAIDISATVLPLSKGLDQYLKGVLNMKSLLLQESKSLYYAVLAGNNVTDIKPIFSYLQQKLRPNLNIKTEFRTAAGNLYQAQRAEFFKELEQKNKKYEYVGVKDKNNREFCSAHLGRTGTESYWKNLDNGQGGSAWHQLGGYNCRHMLLLVPEEEGE